jgi:CubicO group peptidase (beta-lactamase class C family)
MATTQAEIVCAQVSTMGELAYNPGTSKGYSNIGYLTLGMVVEAVTGRKYEDVCREAALDPMGVTGMIDPALMQRAPNGGWLMSAIEAKFLEMSWATPIEINEGSTHQ